MKLAVELTALLAHMATTSKCSLSINTSVNLSIGRQLLVHAPGTCFLSSPFDERALLPLE